MIIRYQKFKFTLQAIDQLVLPYYKGSTFRGGFGTAFRRVVCALKRKDCKDCMLKTKCIYAYIFETSPSEDTKIMNMNKYETVPHPFIIEPPEDTRHLYEQGDNLAFNLILIGRAVDYLPYFIFTFDELGKSGIGKGRGKYRLIKVDSGSNMVYSSEERTIRATSSEERDIPEVFDFNLDTDGAITLRFLTPTRIIHQRALAVNLEFHILIRSLLRRLCLLHYFHCEKKEPSWDHKQIIHEAEKVTIENNALKWWDWERYSSRQDIRMKMGGVVGYITYKGNPEQFLPILRAGEILHVGKGTSFGLGRYELH